jgi:hypothetical protein
MLVYIAGKALHTYNTHTQTHFPWIHKFVKMTVPTATHTHTYIHTIIFFQIGAEKEHYL